MSVALAAWGLASIRIWAILRAQILWRTAVPLWALVAIGIAALLATLVPVSSAVPTELGPWLVAAAFELLLGSVIGIVAALPGHALIGAVWVSGMVLRTAPRPLVGLGVALALATALGIGLHRPLVLGIVDTFGLFAPGDPRAWIDLGTIIGTPFVLRAAHGALLLALALATPVLLTAAVVELALGLVGQGPGPTAVVTAAIRPWLRTAAGLVALGASWAAYGAVWAGAALV